MTRERKLVLILLTVCMVAVIGLGIGALLVARKVVFNFARSLQSSGINNQFGDQWLKSAVAQIELHKLRYGQYPKTLQELRFLSPMDQSILYNVDYFPNSDLTAYYLEVRTGFLGKPHLEYPDEFWQGTGFRKDLKPTGNSETSLPKPNLPLQPAGHKAAGG